MGIHVVLETVDKCTVVLLFACRGSLVCSSVCVSVSGAVLCGLCLPLFNKDVKQNIMILRGLLLVGPAQSETSVSVKGYILELHADDDEASEVVKRLDLRMVQSIQLIDVSKCMITMQKKRKGKARRVIQLHSLDRSTFTARWLPSLVAAVPDRSVHHTLRNHRNEDLVLQLMEKYGSQPLAWKVDKRRYEQAYDACAFGAAQTGRIAQMERFHRLEMEMEMIENKGTTRIIGPGEADDEAEYMNPVLQYKEQLARDAVRTTHAITIQRAAREALYRPGGAGFGRSACSFARSAGKADKA